MSLSIIMEGVTLVAGATTAIDKLGSCTGLTFAHAFWTSRILGVVLDVWTIVSGYTAGAHDVALFFGIHFILFRGPMLFWAPYSVCVLDPSTRRVKRVRDAEYSELFWKGSFMSAFTRVQYLSNHDYVVANNCRFFWISLFTFAFLQMVDVATFCLAFFFKLRDALSDSYNGGFKVPFYLSLTLGIQGALTLGGLVSNYYAFHLTAKAKRRSELLAGGGQMPLLENGDHWCGSPTLANESGSARLLAGQPQDEAVATRGSDEYHQVEDGCCQSLCQTQMVRSFISLVIALGYVLYALLIVFFLVVGGFAFYAFIIYYDRNGV